MTVAELKTMSVDERLVLMEELWDSLCHENVSAQSPEWHKEILDDRIDLINAGKAEYISILPITTYSPGQHQPLPKSF